MLGAIRELKAQGVPDPFNTEDPRVQSVWDKIEAWPGYDIPKTGIETVEQAASFVTRAQVMIEGGYTDIDTVKFALDEILFEKGRAESRTDNEEAVKILDKSIDVLEDMLSEGKPEKSIPGQIENAIEDAWKKAEAGTFSDITDAVRLLTSTLLTARYKKYFTQYPDKKAYISELCDAYTKEYRDRDEYKELTKKPKS